MVSVNTVTNYMLNMKCDAMKNTTKIYQLHSYM